MKHISREKTGKQVIGVLGENVACNFLKRKGFSVVEKNYRKPWGEIDIIAKGSRILHFIEVKTVSRENLQSISREMDAYRPEDNIHPWKLKRLSRTIQSYLLEKNTSEEGEWQFDVITVFLDQKKKQAKVNFIENVIL